MTFTQLYFCQGWIDLCAAIDRLTDGKDIKPAVIYIN